MVAPRTVLIAEDEPLARETLRDFLAAWPGLRRVGEAADGHQALAMMRSLQPDIVFLDIQMPVMTGLAALQTLVAQGERLPAVVFTTAYDQHAVTAFELQAVDYLLKPFSRERFDVAVQRLMETDGADAPDAAARGMLAAAGSEPALLHRILVRDRGRIFPLQMQEIEYLKSDAKYTQIAARGSSFYVRVALAELEGRLDPARFVRVHRGAIVNLDFVDSMKPDEQSQLEIHMRDGTRLLANRDASKRLRDGAV